MAVNWAAVGAALIPNTGAWLNGLLFSSEFRSKDGKVAWSKTLKKPWYTPPDWVYGPVWTTINTSAGYASYLVWRDGGGFVGANRLPLIAFGTQLALNWAWPSIFFGAHNLKWAFIDIVMLTASVYTCGSLFYQVNPLAGMLFIPYCSWLSLASCVSYRMWRLNKDGPSIKELKD